MTLYALLLIAHAAFANDPSVPAKPVEGSVLAMGIERLAATDVAGTRDEAKRVKAALAGAEDAHLVFGKRGFELSRPGAGAIPLSDSLGRALDSMRQYLDLGQAPSPTSDELRDAFLSRAGVDAVRAVFDKMIDDAIDLDGRRLVLEVGGEATMEPSPRLRYIDDFARPVLHEIMAARRDPAALRAIYDQHPEEMKTIDDAGTLKSVLGVLDRMKARGDAQDKRDALLALATRTIAENSASSFTLEPAAQLRAVCAQDWSGRYVGRWHTHPPHDEPAGWGGGSEPSGPDMQNAVDDGQFLTIAFQPDGFIVYDASVLGETKTIDLNKMKKIVYRSDDWRRHFQERHDALRLAGKS